MNRRKTKKQFNSLSHRQHLVKCVNTVQHCQRATASSCVTGETSSASSLQAVLPSYVTEAR